MKKLISLLIIPLLLLAAPVLAVSFGIGPPEIELEVPGDGSAVATFHVTSDFDGELQVSLEDIPLKVEPTTIPISRTDNNREVELTFYGDESLGQQTFNGKVRFLALTGGNVATGIKIKAKITNLVEGETPVLATPEEPQLPLEEASKETTAEVTSPIPEEQAPTEESEQPSLTPSEGSSFPVLPVAGIAAGTAIVITLIVVLARRRQRY